ncbi:uncharacterized protein LOC108095406 [Drosophila ficusphila]|uniref:uncharacterized protein LOC108095406 n=1 Tax=Drosophila ficusphila TaxID=30025 RepID=UPI001C89490C|nr:uncharacterized protein LOC108095406 [Drosophila ficusphila]
MKTSWSFNCGVLLLCSVLCSGQNATKSDDSQIGIKVKILMQSSSPDSTTSSPSITTTTSKPKGEPTAKSSSQAHEIEEEDDNFHNDRLPALSEDEYNNLGEDANPLHFLKQQPLDLKKEEVLPATEKIEQLQTQIETKPQPHSPMVTPQVNGSPIYITIPIYISTGGKLPLTVTIGDQEVSLRKANNSQSARRKPSTKAPNSFFNRLLEQIEPPKRRTTNRHRSQLKSHIHAMKERKVHRDYPYQQMQ